MILQNKLDVICITPERHEKTCGYWYLVQSKSTSHTAFKTKYGLLRWLNERGLELTEPLPVNMGEYKVIKINGSYYDNMTFEDLPAGVETKQLDNAEYTRATITKRDGLSVINFQNCNVKNRIVFDYFKADAEMEDLK